jgi:AAA ATPase domain
MRRGGRLDEVAEPFGPARRSLVGRGGEIDAVVSVMHGATHGDGAALLISGEAGVGKTALVREAYDRVGADADALWAQCLPLTSLAVPFLPLTSALQQWARSRDVPMPVLGGRPKRVRRGSTPGLMNDVDFAP